ncbi:hypothetical protein [Candidatus Sororendozoicomonas aggregata]|uniref:hypothetical protein n=1 Tax=Candidatus Sororendozoicomonas aggregata TaxID=3073239 RepID=UPI002ED091CA
MKHLFHLMVLYTFSLNIYAAKLIVSSSMPGHGLGDYLYAKKLFDMLPDKENDKALILSGTFEEKEHLEKILTIDEL